MGCGNAALRSLTLFLGLALLASACGGGGGGGGPPPVPLSASPWPLDFGEVPVGVEKQISFTLSNDSDQAVRVTAVDLPGATFTLSGPKTPVDVGPGAGVTFDLRYTPDGAGQADSFVTVRYGQSTTTFSVPVTATTGGIQTVDFGPVVLDQALETPLLPVYVPPDAVSLTLEGTAGPTTVLGLADLVGPGDRVYVANQGLGNYHWRKGTEIFSTTVPNTDRASLDLVPGGGTYWFRLFREAGNQNPVRVRALVVRRPGGDPGTRTLDLNVWLAAGIAPNAANAQVDWRLANILSTIDGILSAQGIRLGEVDYYDIADPSFDLLRNEEMPALLRLSSAAARLRLNLFVVKSFATLDAQQAEVPDDATVGRSPTISGPARNGTRASGVAFVYDLGLPWDWIGSIATHEMCHYLGLYHTVERTGIFDIIDDTPNCPADNSVAPGCPRGGGEFLMHWEFANGTDLTNGQGKVLRAHPLLSPAH